jgi:hypothetical protein
VEGWFSQKRLFLGVDVTVVSLLELDRWDVPEGAVETGLV